MAQHLVDLVRQTFPGAVLSSHAQHGDETIVLSPAAWLDVHTFLKNDARAKMDMLTDLTAVDYPDREPRFEVVSHLLSLELDYAQAQVEPFQPLRPLDQNPKNLF